VGNIRSSKTVSQVVRDGLCTGCGTCVALCPVQAIKLTKNRAKGVFIPKIDENKCNFCGMCYKTCPGEEVDFESLNLGIFGKAPTNTLIGNYVKCYTGYAEDYRIRYNSSSGGLVPQLLIFALEEHMIDGALVTKMKTDDPLEPEPFIATDRKEIVSSCGSKYCPVPVNVALREILRLKNKRFAVVGLPCHIHGMRKVEATNDELRKRIILHIALFCSNAPNFLATEFLVRRLKIRKEDVKSIKYRGRGWPGSLTVELKDGRIISSPYPKYCDSGFGQYFCPERCKYCIDHTGELADISLGDAWLPRIMKEDKIGTSLIITRTAEAERFLEKAVSAKKINAEEIDANETLQSSTLSKKRRLTFYASFTNKKIPKYNLKLLEPIPNTFFDYALSLTGTFLSSKPRLWALLRLYAFQIRTLSGLVQHARATKKNRSRIRPHMN